MSERVRCDALALAHAARLNVVAEDLAELGVVKPPALDADELDSASLSGGAGAPSSEPDRPNASIPLGWLIAGFILLMIVTRGRLLSLLFWFSAFGSGRRSGGGWGGGSFGGGGFGGGFGGFGGGGGFSGGGAGRSF